MQPLTKEHVDGPSRIVPASKIVAGDASLPSSKTVEAVGRGTKRPAKDQGVVDQDTGQKRGAPMNRGGMESHCEPQQRDEGTMVTSDEIMYRVGSAKG